MKKEMKNESNRIITVLVALSSLFIFLIVYLSYFEVFAADTIENNNYNKRIWMEEEYILRGNIVDRNDTLLASSTQSEKQQTRQYQYGPLYSHIIGYSNRELGKEALEKTYNKELLNISESTSINELRKIMAQNDLQQRGNDIKLTIDHEIQQYAMALLEKQKGSIIAMNPINGEVYAMVSYPSYDSNNLIENWDDIVEDEDSPLINRATQGLYIPGSIFKIITAASALENQNIKTNYECKGQITIDGYPLKDYNSNAHGSVDLHQSLVKSCNVAFGQIALELGQNNLKNTAENFLLNKNIPLDIEIKKSIFHTGKMNKPDLASTGIGQGKTQVTPLNMALMASAIANNGKMVQPILVKEVLSSEGDIIKTKETITLSEAISPEIASSIKDMMIDVVNSGTGKNAALSSIQVAGKTGTAQVTGQEDHAWFVGFAPADNPKVAIAVLLENYGSTGGSSAAPIARKLISKIIERIE
jgi:peptidoglycan glycosyltransferase